MAEQKSLIVHVARQTLTTPAKPIASLVGRGLAAMRSGGALAKSQDQDALYQKARGPWSSFSPPKPYRNEVSGRFLKREGVSVKG
jgi:hypothetical protein